MTGTVTSKNIDLSSWITLYSNFCTEKRYSVDLQWWRQKAGLYTNAQTWPLSRDVLFPVHSLKVKLWQDADLQLSCQAHHSGYSLQCQTFQTSGCQAVVAITTYKCVLWQHNFWYVKKIFIDLQFKQSVKVNKHLWNLRILPRMRTRTLNTRRRYSAKPGKWFLIQNSFPQIITRRQCTYNIT